MGLVGLGNVGRTIAGYANAFGLQVIAWSPNLAPEVAAEAGARAVGKDELFRESDVVSLHVRLSDRSRGLVGARELGLMKPSALLINTSRGPLVDEAALIEALRNGRIAGAGLDVYDVEPLPPEHPFRALPNTVLTPHIGYLTDDLLRVFYRDTVEDVLAYLEGSPIRVLNPEALPKREE
jgi:phosphoglycerate dehydrogenase-like enzyme